MSAHTDQMMAAAHTGTGVALGIVALVFAAGIALYLWSRPRR